MKFSKEKQFIGRMFDEISPAYDRMNHIMSAGRDLKWRREAVKYLSSLGRDYKNILDLAAGSGDFGKEFMKLKPGKLLSIDLSLEMLKINRVKIPGAFNTQIKADAEYLPFENEFFDLCGISFGVRNFNNIEFCVKETCRVLKKGGLFVVIEMFKPLNQNLFNKFFKFYFSKLVPVAGNFMSQSRYAYNYLHDSVDNFMPVDSFISVGVTNGFRLKSKVRNFSDIVYTVCFQKL